MDAGRTYHILLLYDVPQLTEQPHVESRSFKVSEDRRRAYQCH